MSMKFRTKRYSPAAIEAVDVERETEQSVWIRGKRLAKRSQYDRFFDSWAKAHAHLLAKAEGELASACRRLDLANSTLGNVKGMKPPKDAA
jgi:hypothetical protein